MTQATEQAIAILNAALQGHCVTLIGPSNPEKAAERGKADGEYLAALITAIASTVKT